jgi:carboxymethylenebutenolidase
MVPVLSVIIPTDPGTDDGSPTANLGRERGQRLAVLAHEGKYSIMYGSWPLPIGSGHRTGYIARPDAAGRFPVVLVISTINGLTSTEKDICRRLARSGLAAVAIDFYRDVTGDPIISYGELPDARAVTDIDEVRAFVASEDVDWAVSADVGLFGLDVGGRFALITAATRPWVKSLALAYTPLTGDEERSHQVADFLSNLPVPVLAMYGTDDDLISASTVDEAQRRNDHGQWLLYDGARHGFLDVESDGFDQASADDAMARLIAFFQASLDPAEEIALG